MLRFAEIRAGQALPERAFTPTSAELFVYNAAIWNPHRIHYDLPYTTQVEGYPAIVIDGPLQGDWLTQAVTDWIGEDARLVVFKYSNRRAAYLGDTVTSGGTVKASDPASRRVTLELFIKNAKGEVIAPGEAVVEFPRG
jgi:3-methylfumaryl-CoA hydratase